MKLKDFVFSVILVVSSKISPDIAYSFDDFGSSVSSLAILDLLFLLLLFLDALLNSLEASSEFCFDLFWSCSFSLKPWMSDDIGNHWPMLGMVVEHRGDQVFEVV